MAGARKRGTEKRRVGSASHEEVAVDDAADDTGADKDFEARLDALELRPGKSAGAIAREHGLDIQRLYCLVFYALLWRHEDALRVRDVTPFPQMAISLRKAAQVIRRLEHVRLPCFENHAGTSRRIDARFLGAAPSELRQAVSHPLEAIGPLADWQRYKRFPMPMEEVQLGDGLVLRLPVEPTWLSPFHLPTGLVSVFDGRKGQNTPAGDDWTRCAITEPKDFQAVANLLEQLACQADEIHATVFRRGRPTAYDRKVFRRRFAEYAVACCGQKLDELGAALYSIVFGEIDAQEYGRLRRRDERETAGALTVPRRKTRTKSRP